MYDPPQQKEEQDKLLYENKGQSRLYSKQQGSHAKLKYRSHSRGLQLMGELAPKLWQSKLSMLG